MATKSNPASAQRSPRNRGARRGRSRMATIQWMALVLVAVLLIIAAFVFYGSNATGLTN